MKKTFVLVILFVFPIVAYLFFASGVHNFGKLPVLSKEVRELPGNVAFKNKITILGFLGKDVLKTKGIIFNLNQKIYKPFHAFEDFQFVMAVPKGMEPEVATLKKEMGQLGSISKWFFVFMEEEEIKQLFNSLNSDLSLDVNLGAPYAFIIDKEGFLRGRSDDEDQGVKYGFDATSVSEINNKMEDDVKVVLAEYRLALKKYNKDKIK